MTPEKPSSPTALLFLELLPQPQGLKLLRVGQPWRCAPWSGGDAELPRTPWGNTGATSAAEMKPSLVMLGRLKRASGKPGSENRIRLALNLTLRDLQKLRQGHGFSTPYILTY